MAQNWHANAKEKNANGKMISKKSSMARKRKITDVNKYSKISSRISKNNSLLQNRILFIIMRLSIDIK